MTTHNDEVEEGSGLSNALRNWVMVSLTFLFVLLYASALVGWLKPLADEKMIVRLEPIIFVIIGYYFGRLPSQANEKTLKGEINRQSLKADAAQHAKEQAQQVTEALEEKVKNAKATLTSAGSRITAKNFAGSAGSADMLDMPVKDDALRHLVLATLSVLNS